MNLISRNISNSLFNNSFFKENDFFKADIYEENNLYKIVLDLPGFKKENISIEYSDGYLSIKASKIEERNANKNFLQKERFYGEYKRTFYVGCISEDKINAKYHNGILNIDLERKNNGNNKKTIQIN